MKTLIGYSDRLTVRPGESIAFKVSAAEHEQYEAQLVRLICGGGDHPGCPPFRETEVSAPVNGRHRGRRRAIHPGSYVIVESFGALQAPRDFTLLMTFMPTAPDGQTQHLISHYDPKTDIGWSLNLQADARLAWSSGHGAPAKVLGDRRLQTNQWYHVFVRISPERQWTELSCHQAGRLNPFDPPMTMRIEANRFPWHAPSSSTPLIMAGRLGGFDALEGRDLISGCFNGRLESPVIYRGLLSDAEAAKVFSGERPAHLADRLLADWDFAEGIGTAYVTDRSANSLRGRTVNLPLRGVKGSRWDGSTHRWLSQPDHYAAIHFHADDLQDCGWSTDITYTVDPNLRSGIYALRLRQGSEEEYLPFFVAAPRAKPQSDVAFLVPTHTYVAYGNMRVMGTHEALSEARRQSNLSDEAFATTLMTGPGTEQYVRQTDENPELGLSTYDHHRDGSAVQVSSWLRPLLNVRPKTILWTFAADLLITDWLETGNVTFDVITDDLVNAEGPALLRNYRVVITGNHPEYITSVQREAVESYLRDGGRLIYMGGNGFYSRTAVSEALPGAIEIRRTRGVTQTCRGEIGEDYLAFTGELGGIWRDIGRPPQRLVGVGFIAQGSRGAPYRLAPGAPQSRAAFALAGISGGLIGEHGCFEGGAAGQEIDQMSAAYGTPSHAIRLASSEGHTADMVYVLEEMVGDILKPEHFHSRVHADMMFFETPNGGAVFSVGSMAWCGSLAHDNYRNDVATISNNVLKRFRDPKPFEANPLDVAAGPQPR
jgi:N,N-dimethylformamidase